MTLVERTIMTKRLCKNGCRMEIYLQYIPVTPKLRWVSFELNGKLHSCTARPLEPKLKQLIQIAIDRMNPTTHTNTNYTEIIHRIDLLIEDLESIRQYLAKTKGLFNDKIPHSHSSCYSSMI